MLAIVMFVYNACVVSIFDLAFSFLLSDLSDMVYVCSMGGAVSGIVVFFVVLVFVVIVFLGPWLSGSNMKVLLFGRDAVAFIILVMLLSTTSIHLQ